MTRLLLVTPDRNRLAGLLPATEAPHGDIRWAASGRQAGQMLAAHPIELVVIDDQLGDMTGLDLVKRLVATHPMTHCAVVSALSAEAFHEASEGLGILMQLPPCPGRADGERLMAHLKCIVGLTANPTGKPKQEATP